jgi:hypothetical protein
MGSEGKKEIVREELSFVASGLSVVRQGTAEQLRDKG